MAGDLRYAFGTPSGDSPIYISSPNRNDTTPSLAIYPDHGWDYGEGKFYSREAVLSLSPLPRDRVLPEYGVSSGGTVSATPPPHPALVEAWHKTLCDPASPRYLRLQALLARGLTRGTVRKASLGHTGTHFSIPVYKPGSDTLVGIRFRKDEEYCDPDKPRYTQPRGQPALVYRPGKGRGSVAICEGEFDTLLLYQYGVDAMTSTAGAGSLAKLFGSYPFKRTVYVCTDQDEAGEAAYRGLHSAFSDNSNLRRVLFPGKDITDALRGLPASRRGSAIQQWFSAAV